MVDIAALGFAIDSRPAVEAKRNLDSMTASSVRTEGAVKSMGTTAQRAGTQSAEASKRAADAARRLAAAQEEAARSATRMRMGVQNAAFQIGDFAVQVAGGTAASRALAMQLPQLLGGFGVMGAVLGAVAAIGGALIPVFSRMGDEAEELDKVSFSQLKSSTEELMSLQERHLALIEARANTQDQTSNRVISSLAREASAQRAIMEIETIRADRQLRGAQAQVQSMREELAAMREERLQEARDSLGFVAPGANARDGAPFAPVPGRQESLAALQEMAAEKAEELRRIMSDVSEEERAMTEELRLQEAQLTLLESAMSSIKELQSGITSGARDQTTSSEESLVWASQTLDQLNEEVNIRSLILQYGEDSVQVAEARAQAERDAFVELLDSKNISEELKSELLDAWDAANGIASVDIEGNIALANNQAIALAANLRAAMAALGAVEQGIFAAQRRAANIAQIRLDTVGQPVERAGRLARADYLEDSGMAAYAMVRNGDFSGLGRLEDTAERITTGASEIAKVDEAITVAEKAARDALKPARGGRGGSKRKGGGRGGESEVEKAAEKEANELKREGISLTEKLRTEEERYADELERINQLHRTGNIDVETYNRALADLNERYAEMQFGEIKDAIKDFATSLLDVARGTEDLGEAFERMVNRIVDKLFEAQIDKMIDSLFGGLSSGPQATGLGGFIATLFGGGQKASVPSFAGGGYTGNGPRTGGVDGKGGFWSLLHPQETVRDHTVDRDSGMSLTINNYGAEVVQRQRSDGRNEIDIRVPVLGVMDSRQGKDKVRQMTGGRPMLRR